MQYTGTDIDVLLFFGKNFSVGQPLLFRGYTISNGTATMSDFASGDTVALSSFATVNATLRDYLDGFSIVFAKRFASMTVTAKVMMEDDTEYTTTISETQSKAIGFYLDQVHAGLSLEKESIKDVSITRVDNGATAKTLWATTAWVVDINQYHGLTEVSCQNALPENGNIIVPGLALGSGSLSFRDIGQRVLRMVKNFSTVGVASLAGMSVNDITTDPNGELTINTFYESPVFSMDSDGYLVSDVDLGGALSIDDKGYLVVDYSTAVDSAMTKSGKACFVFLNDNLVYQMLSKSWTYDTTNGSVQFKLVDVLTNLNGITTGGSSSGMQIKDNYFSISNVLGMLNDTANLTMPVVLSDEQAGIYDDAIASNLGSNGYYVPMPRNVRAFYDDLCVGYGLIGSLEPYSEIDRFGKYRGDNPVFVNGARLYAKQVQYTDMLVLRGIYERPFKPLKLTNAGTSQSPTLLVTKDTQNIYALGNGDLTTAVKRNVIKDNYIDNVSYDVYAPDFASASISKTTQKTLGQGEFPFSMDKSALFYDNGSTKATWTDSLGTTGLADHWAQAYLDSYVIGRDLVSFTTLLRDTLTPSTQASIDIYGVGEFFKLRIDEPAIKSDFNYEIIDTQLTYDGKLYFSIIGLQM